MQFSFSSVQVQVHSGKEFRRTPKPLNLRPETLQNAAATAGVIKAGEKEVYFEAEQRLPVTTPTGSWGTAGYWAQQPGSSGNSGTAVIGSPVGAQAQQQQQLRDSSAGEGCVGIWGPEVQEGDPVGIITIEDVIEEVRRAVACCAETDCLCFGCVCCITCIVMGALLPLPVAARCSPFIVLAHPCAV